MNNNHRRLEFNFFRQINEYDESFSCISYFHLQITYVASIIVTLIQSFHLNLIIFSAQCIIYKSGGIANM